MSSSKKSAIDTMHGDGDSCDLQMRSAGEATEKKSFRTRLRQTSLTIDDDSSRFTTLPTRNCYERNHHYIRLAYVIVSLIEMNTSIEALSSD